MNSMKRQKGRTLKDEFSYATGDQWRNNSRKNEGMAPKQKQHPVVDVTGDRKMLMNYDFPGFNGNICFILPSNIMSACWFKIDFLLLQENIEFKLSETFDLISN